MPLGSHASGQSTCCENLELASLLWLQPGREADMTAFQMRPVWIETNKTHFTYISQQSPEGTVPYDVSSATEECNHFQQTEMLEYYSE